MLTFQGSELRETLQQETGLRPPFSMETFPDLEGEARQSIARLEASPFLLHRQAIRAFVYEVETGRLREVGRTSG